jgi:hypothetical protein
MIRFQLESKSHFIELFSFVRFEYLSIDSIEDFISWSCEYFARFEQFLSKDVWIAICCRLCLSVDVESQSQSSSPSHNPRYCDQSLHFIRQSDSSQSCDKSLHFVPQSDSPLCGIISYLTSQHGGNISDRGIVNVSGSTTFDSRYPAKNAVDLLSTSYFHSQNEPNQWLCYDFKNRKIRPTHYSIHAYSNHYLRSWIFEGSIDGSIWIELDRHTDDQTTNSNHPIGTCSISNPCECQFVRLRQTGVTACGSHYLILHAMEIFGDLIE